MTWPLPSIPLRPRSKTRPATPREVSILELLKTGERSTGQVAAALGITDGRASHVLARLERAGVLVRRRAVDTQRIGVTWTMWRIRK